jgi:hypothetical protein
MPSPPASKLNRFKENPMSKIATGIAVLAAMSLISSPLMAQDFTMSIHDSFSNNRNAIMSSHIVKLSTRSKRTTQSGQLVMVKRPAPNLLGAAFSPSMPVSPTATAVNLDFATSRASRQEATRAFIERLRANDQRAANALDAQLRRYDVGPVFAGIVRPFGMRDDDLADVLSSYVVLGWMVANQAGDPSPRQVLAVRQRVAVLLADNPQLQSPTTRTVVGDELKILFVVLHAGMQSATREGAMPQYSAGVRQMFRQAAGEDLRSLSLTDAGFVRR